MSEDAIELRERRADGREFPAGMLPRHCPWCGAMVVKEGE